MATDGRALRAGRSVVRDVDRSELRHVVLQSEHVTAAIARGQYSHVLLYVLAGVGAFALLLIAVVVLFGWFGQPVVYLARGDQLQRFISSWGAALGDRGRIVVREPHTDRQVHFIKRLYRSRTGQLVLRSRNADETRKYFEAVKSALQEAAIDFEIELTPKGKPRAVVIAFAVEDPLTPSAAAHVARLVLTAMGAPMGGPFELFCEGSHRPDYTPGSVEVIPWTRGYRSGFQVGRLLRRVLGRDDAS